MNVTVTRGVDERLRPELVSAADGDTNATLDFTGKDRSMIFKSARLIGHGVALLIFSACAVTILASIAGSVWPHRLAPPFVPNRFVASGWIVVVIVLGTIVVALFSKLMPRFPQLRLALAIYASASLVLLLAAGLLQFSILPRRVLFSTCKSEFDDTVLNSTVQGSTINKRIGLWYISNYESDPRGGTYFVFAQGAEGMGIDMHTFGFAHRPNAAGTPFGNADYVCIHLEDDWYYFDVSSDY